MTDYTGKVAFITGGASGAGFGQASVFAEAGCKIVIADVRRNAIDDAAAKLRAQGAQATSLVTISLSLDFIGTARIGQWLEIRPHVLRVGGRVCFCEALVMADEALCARANATFSVVQ